METIVEEWFGPKFSELHSLLQKLHKNGGVLSGQVQLSFGQGLAGFVGRRLASRLGVPIVAATHHLQVTICSQSGALHWAREFNGQNEFMSRFKPVGHYPYGHWVEKSGLLSLELGVKVHAGGWYWEHRRTRFLGIPVPKVLLPVTIASKTAEGDSYRFSVKIMAPVLGKLLEYSGKLAPKSNVETFANFI
jgi:hypothetical protein